MNESITKLAKIQKYTSQKKTEFLEKDKLGRILGKLNGKKRENFVQIYVFYITFSFKMCYK